MTVAISIEMDERAQQETLELLDLVSDELKTKVIRRGLDVASKPIVDTMRAMAPNKTGMLRTAINRTKLSDRAANRLDLFGHGPVSVSAGTQAVLIGPNRNIGGIKRAHVANFLEEGTKGPYVIKPKRGKRGLRLGNGKFVTKVNHPGVRARRFMAAAHKAGEDGFEDRFFKGMSDRLKKLVAPV